MLFGSTLGFKCALASRIGPDTVKLKILATHLLSFKHLLHPSEGHTAHKTLDVCTQGGQGRLLRAAILVAMWRMGVATAGGQGRPRKGFWAG